MTNRRTFILQVSVGAVAATNAHAVTAKGLLPENDPQAVSFGYRADASKVDKKKYPKFADGQNCGSCALFQGKGKVTSGPCPLFGNRVVAAKGWCTSWAKKA
jgi:hypothetical protein